MDNPAAALPASARLMQDFDSNIAKPCRKHQLPPRLNWEGIWTIACPSGCCYYTNEDRPLDLIIRYRATPL